MDKEIEIEVMDEVEEIEEVAQETESVQLPLNFLTFGEIENDDVKVYIKQDVYKALEKLAVSDTEKELGSIILGEYCQEHGKTHVVISQYIEAKYTDASASTLTFTHETWDYVHSEHESKYPDQKIVGWQHTHPNYGIFLSNYDLFIHENFFNLPFQVAYVIDPIQNLRGFFQWKNGKIEKLKGYYIYDDVGKPIKIEQIKVKKEEPVVPAKRSKATGVFISLLCILTVILSCVTISLSGKIDDLIWEQKKLQSQLTTQHDVMMSQQTQLATQSGLAEKLGKLELTAQEQEKIIKQLMAQVEKKPTDEVTFVSYTVEAGDTLLKICKNHGLDYDANINLILALNGIADPNRIVVGQRLLLPTP